MKKLMMALVAVATVAVANAATIQWNSGTIYNKAGTKANAKTAVVSATLYSLTADQYASATSMTLAELYKAATDGTYGDALKSQNSNAFGLANISQSVTGGSTEKPVTYYGLVVYTDSVSDGGPWLKTSVQSVSFQDDGVSTLGNLAVNAASWATASVPEPTSGLLLLLGMAGLALKRKIA